MAVKITNHFLALEKALEADARAKEAEVASAILSTVKEGLDGPRSGHTYKIPGTDQTYTASAPGEWPARRTGKLQESFRVKAGQGEVTVGTDHPAALAVSDERPFLEQALAEVETQVEGILHAPWSQVDRLR
ncbi:MAG: hypothetical protein AMXMBFR33_01470 [Candidatus Xenobia bacterium]